MHQPASESGITRSPVRVVIQCHAEATQQEVCDAVARLLNGPAVKDSRSELDVGDQQPEHCAAVKPLAEAVSCVVEVGVDVLPHMAGWRLKCLQLSAYLE